tara:strand:+ start:88 stop:303 length:216 start_codon:yes stop_codon:yes gene_type:complete
MPGGWIEQSAIGNPDHFPENQKGKTEPQAVQNVFFDTDQQQGFRDRRIIPGHDIGDQAGNNKVYGEPHAFA